MIYPAPKPPAKQPKQRKPIQRSRVRTRRTKARFGRLKGNALGDLRRDCFARDCGRCVVCGVPLSLETMEMAHIKNKRMFGDNLSNVRTKCFRCHRIIEHCNGGVEKIVPAK